MDIGTATMAAGGLDVLGSVIQNDANRGMSHESMDFQQKMWDKNYALQKEFAQNGIRWRVDDAVKAGLHPLAAIGMQGQSGSPISVGDVSFAPSNMSTALHSMSQNVSKAIRMQMTPEEKMRQDLELDLLRSQVKKEDSLAGYYDAQKANLLSADHSSGPMVMSERDYKFPMYKGIDGQISIQPTQQFSRSFDDSSRVAGSNPIWQKTEIAPGVFWDMPYSQGESVFESMEGLTPQAITLWKNLYYNPKKKAEAREKKWMDEQEKHYQKIKGKYFK